MCSQIVTSAALALLGEYSHKNNFARRIMGLYLYAAGAQRQTISVMAHLGISESYQNLTRKPRFVIHRRARRINPDDPIPSPPLPTPLLHDHQYTPPDSMLLATKIESLRTMRVGTIRDLSGAMRDVARGIAATGLYAASYDNINMVFRAAEQVVGKTGTAFLIPEPSCCLTMLQTHKRMELALLSGRFGRRCLKKCQ